MAIILLEGHLQDQKACNGTVNNIAARKIYLQQTKGSAWIASNLALHGCGQRSVRNISHSAAAEDLIPEELTVINLFLAV